MRKEEIFDRPPGPFFGFWSLMYIDVWKFLKRNLMGFRKVRKEAFKNTLRPGDPMPPVKLKTTEDETFDLSQFRGRKNLVIEFGAIT